MGFSYVNLRYSGAPPHTRRILRATHPLHPAVAMADRGATQGWLSAATRTALTEVGGVESRIVRLGAVNGPELEGPRLPLGSAAEAVSARPVPVRTDEEEEEGEEEEREEVVEEKEIRRVKELFKQHVPHRNLPRPWLKCSKWQPPPAGGGTWRGTAQTSVPLYH